MVAAAAWESNLKDSDHAAEAFTVLNAGMWGRTVFRKPETLGGEVHEWHFGKKRRWRGAGHLEQVGIKKKRQTSFTKENKKNRNLRGSPFG